MGAEHRGVRGASTPRTGAEASWRTVAARGEHRRRGAGRSRRPYASGGGAAHRVAAYGVAMAFRGWPVEAVEFFEGLEDDNSRAYWQVHKASYERCVKGPMEE